MSYYHVVIEFHSQSGEKKTIELFRDLSKSEISSKLAKPYRKGKDLHVDGSIYKNESISKIRICKTEEKNEAVKDTMFRKSSERLDRMNAEEGGLVIISPGGSHPEDIFEEGEDVTSRFKMEKENSQLLSTFGDRTLTIVCSIIAIVIATYIAFKLGYK